VSRRNSDPRPPEVIRLQKPAGSRGHGAIQPNARGGSLRLTARKLTNLLISHIYNSFDEYRQPRDFAVTDFENKFIPSPFNTLQPIPRLAAPAFCAALFYPEFANEFYRQKSAPDQPGAPVPQGRIRRPRNRKKITKQTQVSALTITKQTISKKHDWVCFWLSSQKRTLPPPPPTLNRVMFQRPMPECSLTTEYRISPVVSARRATPGRNRLPHPGVR